MEYLNNRIIRTASIHPHIPATDMSCKQETKNRPGKITFMLQLQNHVACQKRSCKTIAKVKLEIVNKNILWVLFLKGSISIHQKDLNNLMFL